MTKKIFALILLNFIILPAISQKSHRISNDFYTISKKIDECHLKSGLRGKRKEHAVHHNIRLKLFEYKELDFVAQSDTLFFLEKFEYETWKYYGKIWNTNGDEIDYIYYHFSNEFEFYSGKINLFSNTVCYLISKWDVEGIGLEEKNSARMTPHYSIIGSRVIKCGNGYKVDCIQFLEIFNHERYYYDYIYDFK